MSLADEELFAPRPGDDPRMTIAHYARHGLAVFAVHAETKAPPPGYLWKARATSNVAHAVDDADYACSLWGEANVSIAWALGLDGYVALDLDVDIPPEWWADLRAVAAINTTRRGEHLIFENPPGLVPGNGTSRFPTSGWGEVRGVGGYIIIAGPDRPGLDAEATTVPFPRPNGSHRPATPPTPPHQPTSTRSPRHTPATPDRQHSAVYAATSTAGRRAAGDRTGRPTRRHGTTPPSTAPAGSPERPVMAPIRLPTGSPPCACGGSTPWMIRAAATVASSAP